MFQKKCDYISIGYTDLPHINMLIRDGRRCFMWSTLISEVQFVLLMFLPGILQTAGINDEHRDLYVSDQ